jgi:hypothetical protein
VIGETERDGLQLVTALHDVVQPAGLPVLPSFDIYGRFSVPDDAVEPGCPMTAWPWSSGRCRGSA